MSNQNKLKKQAAAKALDYVKPGMILGVGTGSTVNFFIEQLAVKNIAIEVAVASSVASEKLLKQHGIDVTDLNNVQHVDCTIDGTDEFNRHKALIKGGGAALTREKILAAASKQLIIIADKTKQVDILGKFPLPIEVIPMARSYVARELVKLGGQPDYREGCVTDNGNVILDVYNLKILDPISLEQQINNIAGVVTNGLFAKRGADTIIIAQDNETIVL